MRAHLGRYPDGPRVAQAIQIIEANASEYSCTEYGLPRYLEDFPDNKHRVEALRRKDDKCYRQAWDRFRETPDAWPDPLAENQKVFPEGRHRADADAAIADRLYQIAIARRNRALFESALKHAKQGGQTHEETLKKLAELEAWTEALNHDTYDAYLGYLIRFPSDGMYSADAENMIRYHWRWKPLAVSDKLDKTFAHAASKGAPKLPDWIDEFPEQSELVKGCFEKKYFADLIRGFALVESYYDIYRRFIHFGFEAGDAKKSKEGAIAMAKSLSPEQVGSFVQIGWNRIPLTGEQRRAIKVLSRTALEYERIFDVKFDKVAADIQDKRWYWAGGESWKTLEFPTSADPCLKLSFARVLGTVETTLFDFWYLRLKEGTKPIFSAAFTALVAQPNGDGTTSSAGEYPQP